MVLRVTNETPFTTGWTVGFRADGRELLVVAVKATYELVTEAGTRRGEPLLAPNQEPLRLADEFTGDPSATAPLYETDFAHAKVACDVLFAGSAHVPYGADAESLPVQLRVGPMRKTLVVKGPRVWTKAIGTLIPSDPAPFQSQPISYDWAFGGSDQDPADPRRAACFELNPVGKGFRRYDMDLEGHLMPALEAPNAPIRDPRHPYSPHSFGPLGRGWKQRLAYAGTYDDRWLETRSPLWPDDFDTRYFQAAPIDQQIPFPVGGEAIELTNLVPPQVSKTARAHAQIPSQKVAVAFFYRSDPPSMCCAALDTLLLEPEQNRFSCTWRVTQPMRRDVFDVEEVVVSDSMSSLPGRVRAQQAGKEYVRGLSKVTRRSAAGP